MNLFYLFGEYLIVPIILFLVILAQKRFFGEENEDGNFHYVEYGLEFMAILMASLLAFSLRVHNSSSQYILLIVTFVELFTIIFAISAIIKDFGNKWKQIFLPFYSAFLFLFVLVFFIYVFQDQTIESAANVTAGLRLDTSALIFGVVLSVSAVVIFFILKDNMYEPADYILLASELETKDTSNTNVLFYYKKAAKKAIKYSGHYIQALIGAKDFLYRARMSDDYYIYALKLIDGIAKLDTGNHRIIEQTLKEIAAYKLKHPYSGNNAKLARKYLDGNEFYSKTLDILNA